MLIVVLACQQEHPWHAAVVRARAAGAGIDVWGGAGQGEGWDEGRWSSQVACLVGDGFYHRYVGVCGEVICMLPIHPSSYYESIDE